MSVEVSSYAGASGKGIILYGESRKCSIMHNLGYMHAFEEYSGVMRSELGVLEQSLEQVWIVEGIIGPVLLKA